MNLDQEEEAILAEFADEIGISFNQACGEQLIEGTLHISDFLEIPKGFNPCIDGNLYMRSEERRVGKEC